MLFLLGVYILSNRVRVKICGITRIEDALAAIDAGADALGFVFYPPSPRYVSIEQARNIIEELPPFVTTVGLFVDPSKEVVDAVLQEVPLSLLQFHGDESSLFCEQFKMPWLKALAFRHDLDVEQILTQYKKAAGILWDAWHPVLKGGTGNTIEWQKLPKFTQPMILAGGLTPENVAEAISITQPYAVDVSGGVEQSKGIKDVALMRAFIKAVTQEQ